jgi:Glycosyl transferase family 2.
MHSFSIVIPIYNESNNIKILLKEIYFILKDNFLFEVIIVNDGSNENQKKL